MRAAVRASIAACLVFAAGWPGTLSAAGDRAGERAAGDPAKGRAAFAPCASCHQVGPSARAGFGPPLNGLLGRRAGTVEGYAYSPALKASGIVWTEETLRAFVRNPSRAVPGTSMRFLGLGYDEQRVRDLLAYLKQAGE